MRMCPVLSIMATSMRQRSLAPNKYSGNSLTQQPDDSKLKTRSPSLLSQSTWFIILVFFGILFYFIHVKSSVFPVPKTIDGARPGEFVEERARRYLNDITALGPREVGSEANEVKTVEYLMKELEGIQKRVNPVHEMQMDVQLVSGTFTLKFLGEFSSVYENVKNVIVKLGPSQGAKDSLLVNCHYDTVLDSPGASDDAVTCCLMLEVLNVLTGQDKPLLHNIIFIFNGAEENILQASHGFITQHPWAQDVRAFINLDAAGAGGRELLFQAGPEHPWLTQAYAQNVPHPFASVFGQEIFESGIIPSDTDFRIYRDYGNIPGLDIAYIHNGYIYHTKWDTPEMIPSGCIQRGGENLLALVQALANSPLLTDPGEYKHGHLVFFDVVGLFMVLYPARIGNIVNVFMVIIVLVGAMRKVLGVNRGSSLFGLTYLNHLLKAVGVLFLSAIITILAITALGFCMNFLNRPMSWFSRPWMMIGLYIAPALFVNISIHCMVKERLYKHRIDLWDVEAVYFDAAMLMEVLVLAAMTYCGINSAVLFLISVLFPLLLRDRTACLLDINFRESHVKFVTLHLLGTFVPCLLKMYFLYGVLDMFIPVMGRIGTSVIPDVFIAGFVSFFLLVIVAYQMQLVYVSHSVDLVRKVLGGIFAVTFLAVIFSPLGFPYQANSAAPSHQRHILHHVDRTFHDITGKVTKNDSGIWLIPFDDYALRPLEGLVPMLEKAEVAKCEGPYCGWPYYFAMLCIMRDTYYIPAAPLTVKKPELSIVSQNATSDTRLRILMEMSGPHHINVYLTPKVGVTLVRWSVGNGIPHPTAMPPEVKFDTFFIYYAYGTKPAKPWRFWVEVEIDDGVDRSKGVLDIALGGHYWFGDDRWTPALKTYLSQLPDWTFPVAWTATYEAWAL